MAVPEPNALENNANGLSNIVITGNVGDDIFANDGDNVAGIDFFGMNGRNTLINTGNYVSGISSSVAAIRIALSTAVIALQDSTFQGRSGRRSVLQLLEQTLKTSP